MSVCLKKLSDVPDLGQLSLVLLIRRLRRLNQNRIARAPPDKGKQIVPPFIVYMQIRCLAALTTHAEFCGGVPVLRVFMETS